MKLLKQAQKYGTQVADFTNTQAAKAGVVVALALASMGAHADPAAMLESIDLSGVATKVLAIGIIVIGIAFTIRGIVLSKRVVNKV